MSVSITILCSDNHAHDEVLDVVAEALSAWAKENEKTIDLNFNEKINGGRIIKVHKDPKN